MKNLLFSIGLLVATALLTGCPKPEPKKPDFDLGKPFVIAQGQTMQSEGGDLSITFDKVSGDSRCPQGVQCIWAGRADCVFTLTKKASSTESITLSSGDLGQGGATHTTFGGYVVTLTNVAPPKNAKGEIAQKDYQATLTVAQ